MRSLFFKGSMTINHGNVGHLLCQYNLSIKTCAWILSQTSNYLNFLHIKGRIFACIISCALGIITYNRCDCQSRYISKVSGPEFESVTFGALPSNPPRNMFHISLTHRLNSTCNFCQEGECVTGLTGGWLSVNISVLNSSVVRVLAGEAKGPGFKSRLRLNLISHLFMHDVSGISVQCIANSICSF